MSEVIADVFAGQFPPKIGVLSGPTFAREIASGCPAAVVIASDLDPSLAANVQKIFSGPTFRLYCNDDPIGVEIGAALKNVVAIGAGICSSLELGSNAMAALITRGLAEITRLAVALGGKPATLAGLAGLGDLVLTCTGERSRNRAVGIDLPGDVAWKTFWPEVALVAEGVETVTAAVDLAGRLHVEMPITTGMASILAGIQSPRKCCAN